MPTRKLRFSLLGFVAAFGLLAGIAAAPAEAVRFTLEELDQGQTFRVAGLEFFDWGFDEAGSTNVDPGEVEIETLDSDVLPGFLVLGSFSGDRVNLQYDYSVRTLDGMPIDSTLLWLTSVDIVSGGPLSSSSASITLSDTIPTADFALSVGVDDEGFEQLSDATQLRPPLDQLSLRTELEVETVGEGFVRVNRYANLFTVVPEPGTTLLLGMGLAGLGVFGRSRRTRREGPA